MPTKTSYYDRDVNFDRLTAADPDIAPLLKSSKARGHINFQDAKTVQQLTYSLLKCDFGLTITLPDDRLCPPVPVRWNYIHWIQELLDTTSPTYHVREAIRGHDIGVGASCIYPLLACSSRQGWTFTGTEIDPHSLSFAQHNINTNSLSDRITLALVSPDASLIPTQGNLDFTMTNPPFYSTTSDLEADNSTPKSNPASAVCTGSANEMVTPGGEVAFVTRIITESLILKDKVQWYTAMLGHLHSLQTIVITLKRHKIGNFAVASLQAGWKTNRWAVAWSFRDFRPRCDVARHGNLVRNVLPVATARTVQCGDAFAARKLDEAMRGLGVEWKWEVEGKVGIVMAERNVWSRAARRRRDSREPPAPREVLLACRIVLQGISVEVNWLKGNDDVLFLSFCGMLKRLLA
ncbi:hypothetical protein K470DRAFT_223161 [Piedraia hortae CBS 480.64]|uniref:U6 small nuclear RNA (adenine-(43)-N(6))-methyltransferase n=1 Tax=Piedraia hortae CBS 480.64 TaxID=1314780 RepID=A0A6A7BSQ1_9PEZI|nr:hypothetical protein K470DRAFT_223161 [Piedraia hortae CBS 480.64]